MGQPAATSNPQSYYWRHAAVGIFSVIFLGILFSFFSSETVATTKRVVNTQTVIQLNEEVLSQIHSSQQAQINEEVAANLSPVSEVESKPVPNLTQTTLKIKAGHSLAAIFKKQQLSSQDLYRIMQKGPSVQVLTNLQPGHTLNIESDTEGQLYSLTYQVDKLQSININRNGDDFHVATSNKQVEKRVNFTEGQIQSSLFEAGKEAGLSDALVMEMAGIFGWDVDFALDIREGDKFSVLYEENFVEGKKYQTGNILAAEFTNQGKTFKAISFTDKSGRTNFYTPEGLSMRKAFLRTPVDFRRISSRFGNRKHPVLNRMRLHKGVDYAAPRGTPIRSSGDGKVIFKGNKGGYGRVIIVQHGSRYQ
ncbi:MAG: peptidoglycan DD-metalloendopeptidase family protein, partial [Gammaproteobacteria bacterium]|nr:peptidoglycan DD-metalloendopeptidase family protein [Gammaproteobacteria bacterium]